MDISTQKHPNTFTVIDKEHYDKIKHLKWYAIQGTGLTKYAQASKGKERYLLHRMILDCPEELVVDHEDGDGLNNRGIGKVLKITEKTVKFHLTNIYRILELKDKTKYNSRAALIIIHYLCNKLTYNVA